MPGSQTDKPSTEPLYVYKERIHPGWTIGALVLAIAIFYFFWPEDLFYRESVLLTINLFVALSIMTVWYIRPHPRLIVYHDHLIIKRFLIDPFPVYRMRFRVPNENITRIWAVEENPFGEYRNWWDWQRRLFRIEAWRPGSVWQGWVACFDLPVKSAIAIETTEKNYLVGCANPHEVAEKLKRIVGIEEDTGPQQ